MKTAAFPTIGTLDETLPATSDSQYQQAALSLTIHKIVKNLSDEGFEFTKPEATDFTAFNTEVNTFITDMNTRFDEILAQGFSEVVANLPDVLNIMAAISSGGLSEVPAILLNAILGQMFHWRDSSIEAAEGEPLAELDVSGIVTQLEAIEARLALMETAIQEILTDFNINVFRDEETQTYSFGPLEEE